MKCSDLQLKLSAYADDFLTESESLLTRSHLDACPVCRDEFAEIRNIRDSLGKIGRSEIPASVRSSLKETLRTQIHNQKSTWLSVSPDIRDVLQMRVMPYSVGVLASTLIGFTFLTMMFSGMLRPVDVAYSTGGNGPSSVDITPVFLDDISPSDYARTRTGFGSESPSVNPQGALIALTKSLVHDEMVDDEVVVVADVYSNGLARIADVVEPSDDRLAVVHLQRALEANTDYAAFVPASLENRPQSVRVVLKFQSVNVKTGPETVRH
ncbi:MAG TPA: zf-HC2 domain-containing protein [Pyrinomonadaceae bacterium]|nr:zf-HC2 domain-containing protein [Pyrinomonadaceae bacterium]